LRTLRYDFATFAVNGFGLFQQPHGVRVQKQAERKAVFIDTKPLMDLSPANIMHASFRWILLFLLTFLSTPVSI